MGDFEQQLFKLSLFKSLDDHDLGKPPDYQSSDQSVSQNDDSLIIPNFYRKSQQDQQQIGGKNTIQKQESLKTNNSHRSKSAYPTKNINRNSSLNIVKVENQNQQFFTPKKQNNQIVNSSSVHNEYQQDTTQTSYNKNMLKTTSSNYIQSNEKDHYFSNKKNYINKNSSKGHKKSGLSQSYAENDGLNKDSDSEEREEIQRRRNFELNMESKRQMLEFEFEQSEDRRRAQLKQLQNSQTKSQLVDVLNGWVDLNKKKEMQLQQLQNTLAIKDSGKPPKLLFKKLNNSQQETKQQRSLSAAQYSASKSQFNQRLTFHNKNTHSFGYIIPQSQYLASTQDFFPLKQEKDTSALEERIQNIKQEIDRVESLIFNQNQIQQNMQYEVINLGYTINKKRKSINGKQQLRTEFEDKNSQFAKIKSKIQVNNSQTKKNLKNLSEQYTEVSEKQKEILGEQVKRSIENQVAVKHQKDNMCNLLIQIEKQKQVLQETEIELEQQEIIEQKFKERNQEQLSLIQQIKVLDDLDSLFLKDQVKYYLNSQKLEHIDKYMSKDQSVLFDDFSLQSPLIRYKQQNVQQNKDLDRKQFLQMLDDFYERHGEGPVELSYSLLNYFQHLSNQFEGHKMAYNELNFQKQEKSLLEQQVDEDLQQLKIAQYDSPESQSKRQIIQQQVNQTQRLDLIQHLYVEKQLNLGVKIFQQSQMLQEEIQISEKTLLYSFMGIAESFIRKAKILLLMQDQCKVNLGQDLSDYIQESINKINKMIRNDVKVLKKQTSEKKFEIPQEFMKDMGNFKRNLGLKLLSQVKLNESSPKKEFDDNNVLILFNEYSDILQKHHKSQIQPDNSVLEKWIYELKNDNIINGFANQNMIINFLKKLDCSEQDSVDVSFSYIFKNMHLLKKEAWNNYQECLEQIFQLEENLLNKIRVKQEELLNEIIAASPKFQNKRTKEAKKNINYLSQQKFPFIKDFENLNQVILSENKEAVNRIESQIDNPQVTPIERKKQANENKNRKAEFDIEFFLEKLKTDGKKNLKKEIIENDEKIRREEEKERRKSSLLFKTDQEEYFQYKESQHFDQNVVEVKNIKEKDQDQDAENTQILKYPLYFQNFNDNNKIQKNQQELENKQYFQIRKRVISCDQLKQKRQTTINYEDFIKPDAIGSARKDLALNSNLINHISKLEASTQSIDKEGLERSLRYQKTYLEDINQNMNNKKIKKQVRLNSETNASNFNEQNMNNQNAQERDGQGQIQKERKVSPFSYLIKARTESSPDYYQQEPNQLQKINKYLFLKTLKEPQNNQQLSQNMQANNKRKQINGNKSEAILKKRILPYKKSFHSILNSILDEQMKLKQNNKNTQSKENLLNQRKPSSDINGAQQENQQNSEKLNQYSLTFGKLTKDNENTEQYPQSDQKNLENKQIQFIQQQPRNSLIKPQKVQNQDDKQNYQQQSQQALKKFLNLKVHTQIKQNNSYLHKNTHN
ncbi:hypothetical protein TTHERM_01009900 (macronuclear) [Tetrahymena thermophila SB210]|uniref:Uncharacterized protein n=1 Tax=Tetrahymena thermophila (strain SB210) TaxID=312017 RepID=Q23LQ6_TETTS|nr:hypothetical protein TTHERM_01009900 [Tetrahymena thermophila SB210]EAR97454.2 hypothetical protein TTHERM_01009900 [Tetrahymena thermophila SB210]|eukprot:XP_001017699.2 hypothetical protein TTHERM_01009900 [Tetrahymena thermophila SB210]